LDGGGVLLANPFSAHFRRIGGSEVAESGTRPLGDRSGKTEKPQRTPTQNAEKAEQKPMRVIASIFRVDTPRRNGDLENVDVHAHEPFARARLT
jgi:hypothetical protein